MLKAVLQNGLGLDIGQHVWESTAPLNRHGNKEGEYQYHENGRRPEDTSKQNLTVMGREVMHPFTHLRSPANRLFSVLISVPWEMLIRIFLADWIGHGPVNGRATLLLKACPYNIANRTMEVEERLTRRWVPVLTWPGADAFSCRSSGLSLIISRMRSWSSKFSEVISLGFLLL